MSRCDKCGKETDRIYGMTNGEFYCKKCAGISNKVNTGIDDPRAWNVKIFSTEMPDRFFQADVTKWMKEHANCKFETHTCAGPGKYFLTILYKEKD